jgi:ketol-acid reductoisomerase
VKKRMQRQLKVIESGKFAKEWVGEFKAGCKNFNKIRRAEEKHGIEKVGAKLRGLMSWLGKKTKKVGKGVSQASYVSTSK